MNQIINTISKCIICSKPVKVAPLRSEQVPQFRLRCPKHQKELEKAWPAYHTKWKEILEKSSG